MLTAPKSYLDSLTKNQSLQIVVKLKWSMVLGHLPHSQCRVPETMTSKHGTKHGTLGPGFGTLHQLGPQLQLLIAFPLSQVHLFGKLYTFPSSLRR